MAELIIAVAAHVNLALSDVCCGKFAGNVCWCVLFAGNKCYRANCSGADAAEAERGSKDNEDLGWLFYVLLAHFSISMK